MTTAKRSFTLTSVHLAMLLALSFEQEKAPFEGGPVVDKRKPFGEQKLVDVIAPALGIAQGEDDKGKKYWPAGTKDKCLNAYAELAQVLQVTCSAQSFAPGVYAAEEGSNKWRRAS